MSKFKAAKEAGKLFEYYFDRLLRGFRKDQGREPENLEIILIRQEAGNKAKEADKVVEVQFGNSATLYRDFYKFQYGLQNGLLSLSVLIVPINPKEFFPTRPRSISNMAEYDLALRFFTILPISVPTMVIGLMRD